MPPRGVSSLILLILIMREEVIVSIEVLAVIVSKEGGEMEKRSHKILHGSIEVIELVSLIFGPRVFPAEVKQSIRERVILVDWHSLHIFIAIVSILNLFCADEKVRVFGIRFAGSRTTV